MTLHVAVSGWLLGAPSGANHRLLSLVQHAAPLLAPDERITVLLRAAALPPRGDASPLPTLPNVCWLPVPIPAGPALRRARAERRQLPGLLRDLGATVLDHGLLPLPRVELPTVLTLHDLRAADGLTRWPRWFARSVLRASIRRSTHVVVPSQFTALRVANFSRRRRCEVIPNGVELPPESAATPPVAQHNGYLLHVGHVERRKNLAVLLRALAQLPAAQRPELRLVGRDAGEWPRLAALARGLGIAAQLQHLGVLGDAAVAEQYAAARAVVVPSVYEGFGLPALEGLAHGRPVLVAAAGALPEVVGDAGTVLPPHDVAAWAAAIAASANAGIDARRRARAAQFGWQTAAQSLLTLWRDAAQRSSTIMP